MNLPVAIACECDELLLDVVDRDTGAESTKRLAPPPGHDCRYVKMRNELISVAWYAAGRKAKNSAEQTAVFHAEMDRLVRELFKQGRI